MVYLNQHQVLVHDLVLNLIMDEDFFFLDQVHNYTIHLFLRHIKLENPIADQSGLSGLVSRQQQRMDMLEEGLKDVRGTIEMELRNIRTELENIAAASVVNQSGASSDFKSFQGELAKLADNIGIVGQRINNTLDLYSDIEFRILRLEKRLNTLLSLSGDDIAEKLAQTEVAGAGAGPSVSMSRDASTVPTRARPFPNNNAWVQ